MGHTYRVKNMTLVFNFGTKLIHNCPFFLVSIKLCFIFIWKYRRQKTNILKPGKHVLVTNNSLRSCSDKTSLTFICYMKKSSITTSRPRYLKLPLLIITHLLSSKNEHNSSCYIYWVILKLFSVLLRIHFILK